MIYTVTFNPALDYIVRVPQLQLGTINRVNYEQVLPGGKGINVSIVLSNLGHDSVALGFKAGFTGQALEAMLSTYSITSNLISVSSGMTRINVKAKSAEETEINGMGPDIQPEDVEKLLSQLDELTSEDILVVSGSVPAAMPQDSYQQILKRVAGRGIRVLVDAERYLLVDTLELHPFLVKPNNHELGDIFSTKLTTRDEVIPYAKKLQDMGARNVLISMAGEGAVLVAENGACLQAPAPKGTLVNSVGAGDSMVAGFIAGWLESNGDPERAFKMGVASGSASAFSSELCTRSEVDALLERL